MIVRVEHESGVGGVAAEAHAEALANRLAGDFGAGIQQPRYNGCIGSGNEPLQHF